MSTLIASNLQASGATGTAALLASINGGPISGARNRIINGDMRIDQRNAGAAVTASGAFPVDRFSVGHTSDGAFSAQRDTLAPAGFTNSLKVTCTTADASLSASQYLAVLQLVEGLNSADFDFGLASAKPITLSFWVRSSLTGTFGGAIRNNAANRAYPFTYAISSANTWEFKSITIPGDTTGTWLSDNGVGLRISWGLGGGTDWSGTAGAWNSNNNLTATSAVSLLGTLNATWQITGVQLEAGTVATPFERRSYGQELYLCQRYYQKNGLSGSSWLPTAKTRESDRQRHVMIQLPTQMRATPSMTLDVVDRDGSTNSFGVASVTAFGAYVNILATADGQVPQVQVYSVSAEL